MSGLDEQYTFDDECPKCYETPTSWRGCIQIDGISRMIGVVWKYTKQYLEGELGLPYNEFAGEYIISKVKNDKPYVNAVVCSACFCKFKIGDNSGRVEKFLKWFKQAYRQNNLYRRNN